jgi:hypothetical protein
MSETINRERLTQFLSNVEQEIQNMQAGEGTHRPGTLHFEQGKNSCPAVNRLEVFRESPTQKNLDQFIELAIQDFGRPTGEFFKNQSQAIFTDYNEKKAKPTVKAFDVAIKDGFYDMFKTAHIPMDPKQMEMLERHSLKMAKVFEDKVSETVAVQLAALVAALKKKESE